MLTILTKDNKKNLITRIFSTKYLTSVIRIGYGEIEQTLQRTYL